MGQVKEFLEYIFGVLKFWVIIQPWQQGLRVRIGKHVKLLEGGIYFKLPYFDSVFAQEIKLRVKEVPIQTVTTKDGKTITLSSNFGYQIKNIRRLYDTLHQPESTVTNVAMSKTAEYFFNNRFEDITIDAAQKYVLGGLEKLDYGIEFKYFKVANFAVVKTFRIIKDETYHWEGMEMNESK